MRLPMSDAAAWPTGWIKRMRRTLVSEQTTASCIVPSYTDSGKQWCMCVGCRELNVRLTFHTYKLLYLTRRNQIEAFLALIILNFCGKIKKIDNEKNGDSIRIARAKA